MKEMGVLAGALDLVLFVPNATYHGLFIEMKHGTNKMTFEQQVFARAVMEKGYAVITCWTFEEFKAGIEGYLNDNVIASR